jgi:hypothetical protein
MAGSTNFQQWNPSANNQESDAAYATDSQRVGGAPIGATFPSPTGNKLFYQVSTGITALMQMMATKGYVVDDTNIATLAAVLSAIQTGNDLRGGLESLSYSASIACNTAAYTGFEIALSGNTTVSISGGVAGDRILFIFVQDGAGGHTVTWPGNFYGAQQPDPGSTQTTAMLFDRDAAGNYRAAAPAMSSQGTALLAASPASNDNSLRIATTAWALLGFAVSLGTNGYVKFPTWLGGWILQWAVGTSQSDSSVTQTVPFLLNFPTNCFTAMPGTIASSFNDTEMPVFVLISSSTSGAVVAMQRVPDHGFIAATPTVWAIGN